MKNKITLSILLMITTLLINGCGVSQEEYDSMKEAKEEAERELASTEDELSDLQTDYDSLKAELDAYKNENASGDNDISSDSLDENTFYDNLQKIFLLLSFDTSPSNLEALIEKYSLSYTKQEYDNGEILSYVVAFTEESARQTHAESGDRLKVSFSNGSSELMDAEYSASSHSRSALLYNYGTWYSLREKSPGNYTGYYVIGALSDESGITIKYDNGNETETDYFPCNSAEDALKKVILS